MSNYPTKEQIIKDAKDLLKASPTRTLAFCTEDGNIFWEKNLAINHQKREKLGAIIDVEREAVKAKASEEAKTDTAKNAAREDKNPPPAGKKQNTPAKQEVKVEKAGEKEQKDSAASNEGTDNAGSGDVAGKTVKQ